MFLRVFLAAAQVAEAAPAVAERRAAVEAGVQAEAAVALAAAEAEAPAVGVSQAAEVADPAVAPAAYRIRLYR